MKPLTYGPLAIIAFGVLFCLFVIWLMRMDQENCKQRYGNEWRSSGSYTKYCTNPNGDIKGY